MKSKIYCVYTCKEGMILSKIKRPKKKGEKFLGQTKDFFGYPKKLSNGRLIYKGTMIFDHKEFNKKAG